MNKEKERKRTRSVIAICFTVGVLCVIILTFVFHNFVFVIENIKVEGNLQSSSESIVASSGIAPGEPMYSIDKGEIYERIKKDNPYIEKVSVKRDLPSVIRIIVTESESACYTEIAGEYFILSDSLRVLEYTENEEYARKKAPCRIVLPDVLRVMVGEKVAFEGASDMSYIMTVLKAFGESELGNRTELISLKNKFGIYAVCDGLYRIEFGSSEDMSSKLKGALATINSSGFEAGILSILDVSVPNEVSVISDNTITLVPNE